MRKKEKQDINFVNNSLPINTRKTGIDIIGDVPWGTHLCQFYQTKEDLIDILVPYFKAGLENNEFCMWITSKPLKVEDAKKSLKKEVKNLDIYINNGQIEILDSTQWYTKSGAFNSDTVLAGWISKEKQALRKGFYGLRLTGNTFWLEKKDWEDFKKYEEVINSVIGKYKMIAICSYSLDKCNASEIIDVVSNHQFALIKREGQWHRIESPEIKKTEKELIEQRQLFETVVNSMPTAVNLIRGSDLTLQLVNPMYQAIAPGKKMIGKTLDELWPETGQNFKKLCRKVLSTGKPHNVTDELNMIRRRPNGPLEPAYFSWSLIRVRLPGEEGWGILNTAWETTERKKVEEERERSLNMLDQVQDAIIVSDADFRIRYWNKGAEKMYGFSRSEALGKTTVELLRPIYASGEREKIINELNHKDSTKAIITTKHRDGTEIIVEINATRINNEKGGIAGYVVVYRDVTDRKKAEVELKRKQAEINTLFDNSPAGLVLFDANLPYKVLIHNKFYQELFAEPYKSKGMIGLNVYDYAPDAEASGVVAMLEEVIHTKQPKSILDFPYKSNPPKQRWFNWYLAPIIVDGTVVALVSMSLDVTDLHNALEEFKRTNEELIRFNRAMVDREIRMVELKKQINDLSISLGNSKPYHIDSEEE